MKRTIGIFAHVDAGKTTFAEQLLYTCGAIRQKGRVDHKNTVMDSHDIEKDRGITIFADQYNFTYEAYEVCLMDTPGHVDFSPAMERTIRVIDAAIVVVNGVDGVQGHTETIWELLKAHKVPTYVFVNKLDQNIADYDASYEDLLKSLESEHFHRVMDQEDLWTDSLIEAVAETDDQLLEAYFEGQMAQKALDDRLSDLIKRGKWSLVYGGSAMTGQGVMACFLHLLKTMAPKTALETDDFQAYVYKIEQDSKGHRISHVRVQSGHIATRDMIDIEGVEEKVTHIRRYKGYKYDEIQEATVGDIIGLVGLKGSKTGMTLGSHLDMDGFVLQPTLQAEVILDETANQKEVLSIFQLLADEEPTLLVTYDPILEAIQIQVMGQIQLEVLEETLRSRFGQVVAFGEPKVLYKETVNQAVVGYGHFEPLKHYAEVHIRLEPAKRGEGIVFVDACRDEDLVKGHRNLIRHHVFEMPHAGILTGHALTDVKVTLLRGRAHNKHTSGGDFREATKRALRQAQEQVEMLVLEPYYQYKMKAPLDLMGDLVYEVQQASGTLDSPVINVDTVTLMGRVPVASFYEFPKRFGAMTGGKGRLQLKVTGYDTCHNSQEVIEACGYDKDRDPSFTSNSVFCAKGSGYTVPWQEAKRHMHCLS